MVKVIKNVMETLRHFIYFLIYLLDNQTEVLDR